MATRITNYSEIPSIWHPRDGKGPGLSDAPDCQMVPIPA